MLPLHQCHIPDLVNVQVGKTSAWWNGLYHQRQGTCIHVHPFGRASTSVINRPIRAWSLLSPTCPSGDIRAMPSVSRAATPMKPRANPGNRTRQPKGCADRIAKPARLSRASQNHLMMIIPNKTVATTVATTVAQHDCEPLAVHAQSETAACERHVLCANFSKTRALFLLLSHRPRRKGRAGAPHGGSGRSLVSVFWRVVWYLHGRDRINVVPVAHVRRARRARRAWSCVAVAVACPCRVRAGVVLRRRRMVATRRRMLVFAMVFTVPHYPGLHNQLIVCIVIAITG